MPPNKGLNHRLTVSYIERKWIQPHPEYVESKELKLDREDLARIYLIQELQEEFGVNDEAVPIILDLLDQIHCLRQALRDTLKNSA